MSLSFIIEMRRVIQNCITKGFHTGKRELLLLTENIGAGRAVQSFGMMWSGVVSVVGSWSLVSGLARLQFGVHVKDNTVRNVRVEPYALQEDQNSKLYQLALCPNI